MFHFGYVDDLLYESFAGLVTKYYKSIKAIGSSV